ncbi:MAG: hypothetical protein D6722_14215 [Bacteroidetes bacterium]|nr:MAG: hypothetical protein D6722_14215 [Bacteroidota bacterium]
MYRHALGLWVGLWLCASLQAHAPEAPKFPLETLINRHLTGYSLSKENRLRLALYAELKGDYESDGEVFTLDFGKLGSLAFYEKNLLLRFGHRPMRAVHLNRFEHGTPQARLMDSTLHAIFEQIPLLRNGEASPELIRFVDKALARKNLEPFSKIYIRHVLLQHGTYDLVRDEVTFHSRDLAQDDEVRRPPTPMMIRLNQDVLRGYYIRSGGTVFVENVDRKVHYATGEDAATNVAAFKVFAQQLFVQTVQYVSQAESERIAQSQRVLGAPGTAPAQGAPALPAGIKPLYTPYSWIPMMLGILRNQRINVGDADVICYFVDADYFDRLYAQLLPEEKAKVDAYLRARRPSLAAAGR